ncbi:MAG: HPF/RaiA family ribosome-associated protein [Candidatus Omnitrophica bacterium]|nr:HPF/RaiA family ribosome-associated protein [Candidatus Omnitrophota bacterium]
MNIKIHSEIKINKEYEDYIKEKIEKLKKFMFDDSGYVEFYIKKDGPLFLTEIYLHSKNLKIFLKEKGNDLNKSVEILFDRTKGKLRKTHDKIINK